MKDSDVTRHEQAVEKLRPRDPIMVRLLALLELADKGSRALDVRVWLALFDKQIMVDAGGYGPNRREVKYESARKIWTDDWERWDHKHDVEAAGMELDAPHYTTSLDAALTLCPERGDLGLLWRIILERKPLHSGPSWIAEVREHAKDGGGAVAHTPALALCIAALKARP